MQSDFEKQFDVPKLLKLEPDDKRNLVGFFELLAKVDKRINSKFYPNS